MALFQYKAVSSSGSVSKGVVDAPNLMAASELLEEKGLVVLQLNQGKKAGISINLNFLGGVKQRDVVIFSRQLAVMVAATVPIVPSLRILNAQMESPALKNIAKEMADDVDGGLQMSQAFAKHPEAFNRFFVAMIRSGETSGRLDEVLNYLADQMEKDYDLSSRIKGAMVYPAFIVTGLVVVGTIMMIFVIPKITALLIDSGVKLPFATRLLIAISSFMVNYWWVLLLLGVAGGATLRAYLKTKAGRIVWDNFKLYFPIFGMIVKKVIIVRMARSLSTLIRGGVTIGTALEITGEVVDNAFFQDILAKTIKEVQDGNSITTVMSESKVVPKIVSEMMAVGEKTGKLDDILERLAGFYDREVSALVASLTSLIEPIIMVVMGLGVALMVVAVMLPMFQLANAIN
jgi:type IV pilus assembly protein PilC